MGKHEIKYKLDTFFDLHQPLTEECHAVYLMVEIRKLLDRTTREGTDFPLLRFYCDWTLHTQKDKHLNHISPIINRMYDDIRKQLQLAPWQGSVTDVIDFMYFKSLQVEMDTFFRSLGITTSLTTDDTQWLAYISLMVSILSDQPIINPIPEVSRFSFQPATRNCVCGVVEFTKSIHGWDEKDYDHYTFMNAY